MSKRRIFIQFISQTFAFFFCFHCGTMFYTDRVRLQSLTENTSIYIDGNLAGRNAALLYPSKPGEKSSFEVTFYSPGHESKTITVSTAFNKASFLNFSFLLAAVVPFAIDYANDTLYDFPDEELFVELDSGDGQIPESFTSSEYQRRLAAARDDSVQVFWGRNLTDIAVLNVATDQDHDIEAAYAPGDYMFFGKHYRVTTQGEYYVTETTKTLNTRVLRLERGDRLLLCPRRNPRTKSVEIQPVFIDPVLFEDPAVFMGLDKLGFMDPNPGTPMETMLHYICWTNTASVRPETE